MEANGWKLYWHPAFGEQFNKLVHAVETIKRDRPSEFRTNSRTKLLKRILEVILDEIPRDPNHANYVQGNTLGTANRHWRRAKFLQRFRLFFRFSTASKIIIYAWVNDEN